MFRASPVRSPPSSLPRRRHSSRPPAAVSNKRCCDRHSSDFRRWHRRRRWHHCRHSPDRPPPLASASPHDCRRHCLRALPGRSHWLTLTTATGNRPLTSERCCCCRQDIGLFPSIAASGSSEFPLRPYGLVRIASARGRDYRRLPFRLPLFCLSLLNCASTWLRRLSSFLSSTAQSG